MAEHEAVLAELCADPDKSDEEMEQCVVDFLSADYYYDDDDNAAKEKVAASQSASAMVDTLQSIWADDVDWILEGDDDEEEETSTTSPNKPKPWSSRSSPSGTFVRDPRTGEMRNIEA